MVPREPVRWLSTRTCPAKRVPRGPVSPPTPPATTSTPTDPRVQVEQAYLHAWDVWADALVKLDASGLSESFTGRALKVLTDQVMKQKRLDQPVRISAEHNYTITIIDPQTASVEDRYINH